MNIHKMNEMAFLDSYFFLRQLEIIVNIQSYINLAMLNTASIFYQQLLHLDYCFIFIVVTYYGQKIFQVPIIGQINSITYIQYEIDNILYSIYAQAWAYIDDIIYRTKSLLNLLEKLCILFNIFLKYNISIKSTKFFLNYFNIRLLGQQVNFLGLTILKKKLKIINFLTYSKMLNMFEYYLGLISYLCNYIHFYTQLAASFQMLKTSLLYNVLVSSQQQQTYTSKIKLKLPIF